MGKVEKKKTNLDFANLIIEYANESGGKDKKELIKAAKLLGKGDPFALASYLESMEDSSREMFFKILKLYIVSLDRSLAGARHVFKILANKWVTDSNGDISSG